jgi:hypothetical protein
MHAEVSQTPVGTPNDGAGTMYVTLNSESPAASRFSVNNHDLLDEAAGLDDVQLHTRLVADVDDSGARMLSLMVALKAVRQTLPMDTDTETSDALLTAVLALAGEVSRQMDDVHACALVAAQRLLVRGGPTH